jgi:hypothetical protein
MHSSTAHFHFLPSKIFLIAALSATVTIMPAFATGGAIAAGAAIGFGSTATAAAWAGAAPAPGMCWYYTDPSRTQGFWDYCQ